MSVPSSPQDNHGELSVLDLKRDLRQSLNKNRTLLSREAKEALDEALSREAAAYAASLCESHGGTPRIAAYAPLPSEPGGSQLLAALAQVAEVWLPVSRSEGVLEWGIYDPQHLRVGAFNIVEPAGLLHDSEVLRGLDAILLPALAVDSNGMRLGKGAGYYDRALEFVAAEPGHAPALLALVYAAECLDTVPHEAHDQPVQGAITEHGLRRFGQAI